MDKRKYEFWNPFHHTPQAPADSTDLEIPNRETIEERWKLRKTVLAETRDHRRVHKHNGMSDTGRNILFVLHDRERRGGNVLTRHHERRSKRVGSKGDRSPLTVFESPVSTAQANMYEGDPLDESNQDRDDPLCAKYQDKSLRRVTYPLRISREIQTFAEYTSAVRYHSTFLHHLGGNDVLDSDGNRPPSSRAVSTISVAFSPDSRTMASTHGDHTVKITCCNTGTLLESLEGHPRTPWTVKFHPIDPRVIASGCLGHQVRVWDWVDRVCLQMIRLEFAIISLSFHPAGKLLAVANGTRLNFWGVDERKQSSLRKEEAQRSGRAQSRDRTEASESNTRRRASMLTEIDQRQMLRCVHFPPNGTTIIIGGVNPSSDDPRRRSRGGIGVGGTSFYLRLWDFDAEAALQPNSEAVSLPVVRRGISNPRIFVPRALLYNDGGFDVSPDGKTLCACAEYWLPDGVDNAMDLLRREEVFYGSDASDEKASSDQASSTDSAMSVAETHSAVSAALAKLKGIAKESNLRCRGPSPMCNDGSEQVQTGVPRTPNATQSDEPPPSLEFIPRTPPIPREHTQPHRLSPPSPPGRRYAGGLGGREGEGGHASSQEGQNIHGLLTTPPPPPPPPPPQAPGGVTARPPHPLSVVSTMANYTDIASRNGRYVPHVVTVSLDTAPLPRDVDPKSALGAVAGGHRPRLGQLLEACPLDAKKASAVTCVKFSPSTDFCLIGFGVREPMDEGEGNFHPVTAVYRVRGGMELVSTMLSGDDDVNIARFHPDSGHGFVYGTKQGRVRILSPRPWNFYNC